MKKNFNELREGMKPERIAQAEVRAKEMMAEIRKQTGLTQEELAESLGIKQSSVSKLESQTDMQVSTLQRLMETLGGSLELIAHLPNGDVRITQFIPKSGWFSSPGSHGFVADHGHEQVQKVVDHLPVLRMGDFWLWG